MEPAFTSGQEITLQLATAQQTADDLTKAQRKFILAHTPRSLLSKYDAHKTYDFVGRVRDLGLIEIVGRWPYNWRGTKLTEFGARVHAALSIN